MGGAIWSTSADDMLSFPAENFVAFFDNHRLLHYGRPVWRTVKGGSQSYVDRLLACVQKAPAARLRGHRDPPDGARRRSSTTAMVIRKPMITW